MDIDFCVADHTADEEIRRLVASQPIPGRVVVSFRREPDYFIGNRVCADTTVVAARDRATGELAGIIALSVADRLMGGSVVRVGYVGQLRVADRYQGRFIPLRGFRFVRDLAAEKKVELLFTAIMAENTAVRCIYADGIVRTFPRLVKVADVYTAGVMVPGPPRRVAGAGGATEVSRRGPGACDGLEIATAGPEDVPSIVRLLNDRGRRRDWLPVHREAEFAGQERRPGFDVADFVLARREGRLVGVAGLWDQSAFKQSIVEGYSGTLARLRPVYNAVARIRRRPSLPAPGEHFRSAYASFVAVERDDPRVFARILAALRTHASARRLDYLLVGLTANDPLLVPALRLPHVAYHSSLYAFSFTTDPEAFMTDRSRIPQIEIAEL